MRVLLVDRLGFERVSDGLSGHTIIVPRRFVPGQSEFKWFGIGTRDGEELIEYREADDQAAELKGAYQHANYLRSEVRRLEGRLRDVEAESARLALELNRLERKR